MLQQNVFMPRQSFVKTKSFYVATELAKVKRNYVMTECFCVATELDKVKINYVVTECFCVAIEFGQGQEFLCRDKVFLCRDRVWPWIGFLYRDFEYFLATTKFGVRAKRVYVST